MCARCPRGWIWTAANVDRAIRERAEAEADLAALGGRQDRNAAWWLVLVELGRQIDERDAFVGHLVWC